MLRHIHKGEPPQCALEHWDDPDDASSNRWLSWREVEARVLPFRLDGVAAEARGRTARALFDEVKGAKRVVNALLTEQHGTCVFCERRVGPALEGEDTSFAGARRAHWLPVAAKPTFALRWENLYASCSDAETCDRAQGDAVLGLPWPCDLAPDALMTCGVSGALQLSPLAGALLGEEVKGVERALEVKAFRRGKRDKTNATLNLNHMKLVAARKAELEEFKTEFERRFPEPHLRTSAACHAWADELLAAPVYRRFTTILVQWLRRRAESCPT